MRGEDRRGTPLLASPNQRVKAKSAIGSIGSITYEDQKCGARIDFQLNSSTYAGRNRGMSALVDITTRRRFPKI